MTTKPIPARPRRNVNDLRAARTGGGMPIADLPPISQQDADAEPPAERLAFPDDERRTTNDERPTANEVVFTRGPARRPAPLVADPLLQWATGLPTTDRRMYAGWLIEAGRHPELDDAMGRAGFPPISIRHSGGVVTHWAVEQADVFVVAEGVQSIGEMRSTWDRYGIVFGWRPKDGRMQSHLRCRVFVRELLAVGFAEPLLLTLKGTLTGDLITALTRQYDVLDAVDAFRKEVGKPPLTPPFYACSIPLGPGTEVTRGSGSTSKEITPIVAQIPAPITKEYIRERWIRPAWVPLVEGLLDDTKRWSETTSRLIAAGEEGEGDSAGA